MENQTKYLIGCNYWGSQKATYMWRDYNKEDTVKDIQTLSGMGVNVLRIFPLWSDFQPVNRVMLINNAANNRYSFKVRQGDMPLAYNEYENKSGLDKKMVENLNHLIATAKEYGIKVIVSILTGWMSGRKFIPELLLGKNLIKDAEAVLFECRFIKDLISQIKHNENILAYEPGNETNCLAPGTEIDEYDAERWLMDICNAIREADPTKPVYSGMHGTSCKERFHLPMQGRWFDMVTVHPYPRFTPYCQMEKLTAMRAAMHAAAESSYYRSIANRPALVEEIGNLGPMITNNDLTPEYFEKALLTSYFAGSKGFLWWCAFEQNHLDFAPYDMQTGETELGLAYADRTPKPVLKKLFELRKDIDEMGEMNVPVSDAVVIISNNVEHWPVAYGAYMLGVQSGYNVDYSFDAQPIKESDYYILPVNTDTLGLPKYRAMELYERVRKGANLLITADAGAIWNFEEITGLRVIGNSMEPHVKAFTLNGKKICLACQMKLEVIASSAKVIATDEEGQIVLAEHSVGKGKVTFLNAPLETVYTKMNYPENTDMFEVYKYFFRDKKKAVSVDNRTCFTTEHELAEGKIGVTFYNFDKKIKQLDIVTSGYEVEKSYFAKVADGKINFEKSYAYLILKSL